MVVVLAWIAEGGKFAATDQPAVPDLRKQPPRRKKSASAAPQKKRNPIGASATNS
jgi:hypothetical protein